MVYFLRESHIRIVNQCGKNTVIVQSYNLAVVSKLGKLEKGLDERGLSSDGLY